MDHMNDDIAPSLSLTWGEPEWMDEPDPELEALAALDRINDRFMIYAGGTGRG